ncbi:MAG: type II toxin-antitoxin system RelE/ParE family toxin [Verrucomicrobiota bacterium]
MIFQFLSEARLELVDATSKYSEQSSNTADKFLNEFEFYLQKLISNPYRRSEDNVGARRQNLKKYPYSIIYMIYQEKIIILAIAPHRKKPYYWKDRLEKYS